MLSIIPPGARVSPLRIFPKAPGFGLLLIWVVVLLQGCAGTDSVVHPGRPLTPGTISGGSPDMDSGPDVPVDVGKIPDPVPRHEPKSKYGNPPSYMVLGKRYHVMNDSKDFVQRGLASWYGRKFHGRRTSSGERYDMYGMTAAHKTLPLPSYLQVTNLKNHRTVVVRVNDRGPFHGERILDLSYTAAKKLGIVGRGTGYVEIRDISPRNIIAKRSNTESASQGFMRESASESDAGKLYVQIGAFKNPSNANKLLNSVYDPGLPKIRIRSGLLDRQPVYRVQLGPIDSFVEARRVIARLGELGVTSARIVNDSAQLASGLLQ